MSVGGVRTAREPPRRQQRVTSSTVRVASPVKATVQTKLHLDGSPPKAPLIVSPPPSVETKRKREAFDYTLDFHSVDFRKNPELYRVGKGEQGVLSVQPYKSEILPLWRFKTPEIATKSSADIYALFLRYRDERDFIGMDMSRKFLQMGYTRSRRYANHASGKKYDGPVPQDKKGRSGAHGRDTLPRDEDPVKAESARIFYAAYLKAREDGVYKQMREEWVAKHG